MTARTMAKIRLPRALSAWNCQNDVCTEISLTSPSCNARIKTAESSSSSAVSGRSLVGSPMSERIGQIRSQAGRTRCRLSRQLPGSRARLPLAAAPGCGQISVLTSNISLDGFVALAGRRFFAAAGSLNPGSPGAHGAGRTAPAETPGRSRLQIRRGIIASRRAAAKVLWRVCRGFARSCPAAGIMGTVRQDSAHRIPCRANTHGGVSPAPPGALHAGPNA